jgi:DNA-binding LacI/PurR family transcriptional regulator
MPVALKDIASEAGVSVGTVSHRLNRGREELSSRSTHNRVSGVSQKRNYHPRHAAQAMRAHKTRVVGCDPGACARQLRECDATAVLIPGNHSMTALEAAHRLQWRIGRDLSIASLDLDPCVHDQYLGVGGMIYDRYEAGRQAAEMVLQTLAAGGQPRASIKIKNIFEPRQTIAPVEEHH